MAISENRVDISSITNSIKSMGDGLLSTGSKVTDKVTSLTSSLVPQSITDKMLGMFNDVLCKDNNYSLDTDSMFNSLNRNIEFGSFDICGNKISKNPFDGSLINGFHSMKANLLGGFSGKLKMPNSLLADIMGNINGTMGKFNLPAGCINDFSLSSPYNVNLSGLDKDALRNSEGLCGLRTKKIVNGNTINALANNRDALYAYSSSMTDKELLDSFNTFLTSRKDLDINNKIDMISNKVVVNDLDNMVEYDNEGNAIPSKVNDKTLMVNSSVKNGIYNTPDEELNIHVDSKNIIGNMDYSYKDSTYEAMYGGLDTKVIPTTNNSNSMLNNNGILDTSNKVLGNNSSIGVNDSVSHVKDPNSVNYSNDTKNTNITQNKGSSSFKGYNDNNDHNIITNEYLSYLNNDAHVKNYASEHDRFFKVRHVFGMTDKTWNKDEDNNISYHKLNKSASFNMMSKAMVHTRQPMLELTLNIPPVELTDYNSIYILNNA